LLLFKVTIGIDKERALPNILRKRKSPPEVENKQRVSNPTKKRKFTTPSKGSEVSFKDIGGNEACLKVQCTFHSLLDVHLVYYLNFMIGKIYYNIGCYFLLNFISVKKTTLLE
jgi:hypothetical protein